MGDLLGLFHFVFCGVSVEILSAGFRVNWHLVHLKSVLSLGSNSIFPAGHPHLKIKWLHLLHSLISFWSRGIGCQFVQFGVGHLKRMSLHSEHVYIFSRPCFSYITGALHVLQVGEAGGSSFESELVAVAGVHNFDFIFAFGCFSYFIGPMPPAIFHDLDIRSDLIVIGVAFVSLFLPLFFGWLDSIKKHWGFWMWVSVLGFGVLRMFWGRLL